VYARDALNGKEGVDGSSPSEGFAFPPAQPVVPLAPLASPAAFDVHAASTSVHRGRCLALSLVKQPDRMLASVAREVTVIAVDHPVLPGTGILGSRRPNGRVRRVVGGRTDGLEV
jgi:hypothetical protein